MGKRIVREIDDSLISLKQYIDQYIDCDHNYVIAIDTNKDIWQMCQSGFIKLFSTNWNEDDCIIMEDETEENIIEAALDRNWEVRIFSTENEMKGFVFGHYK